MVVPKELREKRNFQHQDHGRPQANVGEWLEKSDCTLPSESLQFLAEACATNHEVKGLHHKVLRNLKHLKKLTNYWHLSVAANLFHFGRFLEKRHSTSLQLSGTRCLQPLETSTVFE